MFLKNLTKYSFKKGLLNSKTPFNKLTMRLFSVIGLDMGGTNTCIAVMEPNGPRVIENAEGLRTTPSYISISEDGTEYTAVAAKRIAIQNLYSSFYGTKFFFGRKYSDEFIQKISKRFPFKIEKGPEEEILLMSDKQKSYTLNQVTSMYLKYVKEQADALIGKPVKKVVMAVPGFMTEQGKVDLKSAVKEGGMDVVQFMNESVAAAYAYSLEKNEKAQKIIVFNFGGLNFSLTYLEKVSKATDAGTEVKGDATKTESSTSEEEKNPFEIKNEAYDYFLGGEDIDQAMIKYLLNEFERLNKMDISKDLFALQRIREAAEKAKVELSLSQQAEISLAFLAADHTGPKHLNIRISRSKFETLIDPIITQVKNNCENFLKNNKIEKSTIDEIILVGGISRIPRVQELIKQVFGKDANKTLNPEEAPAMGASIIASQLKLKIEEIKTIDILPLSIGIETLGGNFMRVIPKDTLIPAKLVRTITTVYDNQPRIDLKFYLGEREIAAENKFLGSFQINVPLTKKGDCRVQLTFTVNNKGDFNIQAVEELSKKSSNYSTKINQELTLEYIEDALELSNILKEGDKAQKDLIDLKVEADNFVYNLEKLIKENVDNLENSEDDLERVEVDIDNLNELLKGQDFEGIIKIYQTLQKDYEKIEGMLNKNTQ